MSDKIAWAALPLAFLALVIAIGYPIGKAGAPEKKETAFERVIRTGTIRCDYFVYARKNHE